MSSRFDTVGVVKKVREGGDLVVAKVPGKVPLVISDPDGGDVVGYFRPERRPRVGARVGAKGEWVIVDIPLERLTREDREFMPPGSKPVQHQLLVEEWTAVSDDYDWLLDF